MGVSRFAAGRFRFLGILIMTTAVATTSKCENVEGGPTLSEEVLKTLCPDEVEEAMFAEKVKRQSEPMSSKELLAVLGADEYDEAMLAEKLKKQSEPMSSKELLAALGADEYYEAMLAEKVNKQSEPMSSKELLAALGADECDEAMLLQKLNKQSEPTSSTELLTALGADETDFDYEAMWPKPSMQHQWGTHEDGVCRIHSHPTLPVKVLEALRSDILVEKLNKQYQWAMMLRVHDAVRRTGVMLKDNVVLKSTVNIRFPGASYHVFAAGLK